MDASPRQSSVAAGFGEAELCELVSATVRELQRGMPMLAGVTLASTLDRDLGLDSLGRVELLLRIERAAGVALPEDTLQVAETVADLWQAVQLGRPHAAPVAMPATGPRARRRGAGQHRARPARRWKAHRRCCEVLDAHLRAHPERMQIVDPGRRGQKRASPTDASPTPRPPSPQGCSVRGCSRGRRWRSCCRPRPSTSSPTSASCAPAASRCRSTRRRAPSQLEDHVRRHTGILANAQAVLLVSVPEAMHVARLLQARVAGSARRC